MPYLYLTFAILCEVIGTITLKWSTTNPSLSTTIFVTLSYCLSFFLLWLSLKSLPLGLAYATWSGFGIAATAIAGIILFHEKIDFPAILGLIFIVIGIILLNLVSSMSNH